MRANLIFVHHGMSGLNHHQIPAASSKAAHAPK